MKRSLNFKITAVTLVQNVFIFIFFLTFLIIASNIDTSFSQQFPDCLKCHKDKVAGKYDHPVSCISCHTKAHLTGMKAQYPRYLFAQGVDLCWGCHDKKKFLGKVNHRVHLGCEDPAKATGSDEHILSEFRRIRDQIETTFTEFVRKEVA